MKKYSDMTSKLKIRYQIDDFTLVVLLLIVGVAFVLRIVGYRWGLLAIWQPDEGKFVEPSINMVNEGVLISYNYIYPNQFFSKLVAIILLIYKKIFNVEIDSSSCVEAYFVYRALYAVVSTAIVYVSFLIGNYIKKNMGLILATLVAIFPIFNNLSKQVTGDTAVLLFLTLTVLYSLHYIDNVDNYKYIAIMAAMVALATMEKWHGFVGVAYVGLLLLITSKSILQLLKKSFLAIISFFLVLFICAPNFIFDYHNVIFNGLLYASGHTNGLGGNQSILDASSFFNSICSYFGAFYQFNGGVVLLFFSLIGFWYVVTKTCKYSYALLMGILKIVAMSIIINWSAVRWGCEFYWTMLLVVSYGISTCADYTLQNGKSKWVKIAFGIGLIITLSCLLSRTLLVSVSASLYQQDSRMQQRADCLSYNITPQNTISQHYTGFVSACGVDAEFGSTYKAANMQELLQICDDQLYRTEGSYCYISVTPNLMPAQVIDDKGVERDLCKLLKEKSKLVLSYDVEFGDIFWSLSTDLHTMTFNDIHILCNNIDNLRKIIKGGLCGVDIDVYYIGDLPII